MELEHREESNHCENHENGEELRQRVGLPVRNAVEKDVIEVVKKDKVEKEVVEEFGEKIAKELIEVPVEELKPNLNESVVESTIETITEVNGTIIKTAKKEVKKISTEELLDYNEEDENSQAIDKNKTSYELLEKIGEGTFGSVHLAMSSNGDEVAIKILDDFSELEQEVNVLSELNHPNIIAVKGTYSENGKKGIVMEYVKGKTLAEMIKENKEQIDLLDWYKIALPTLSAFEYAHKQGIIHGDIKPSNILIDEKGNVKICDFGLSQKLDLSEKLSLSLKTKKGEQGLVGTIAYMAPELQRGLVEHADELTDTYSLSLTLYELLTGRLPEDSTDNQFEPKTQKNKDEFVLSEYILKGIKGKSKRANIENMHEKIFSYLQNKTNYSIFCEKSTPEEKEKLKQKLKLVPTAYHPRFSLEGIAIIQNLNALKLFTPEEFRKEKQILKTWTEYYQYYLNFTIDNEINIQTQLYNLIELSKFEKYLGLTEASDLLAKIREVEEEATNEKKGKILDEEIQLSFESPKVQNQLEDILNSLTRDELKVLKREKFRDFLNLRKEYLKTRKEAEKEIRDIETIDNNSHILGAYVAVVGIIASACATITLLTTNELIENTQLLQAGIGRIIGSTILGYIMGYCTGQEGYFEENKNVINAKEKLPKLVKQIKKQLLEDVYAGNIHALNFPPRIVARGRTWTNPNYSDFKLARTKLLSAYELLYNLKLCESEDILEKKELTELKKTTQKKEMLKEKQISKTEKIQQGICTVKTEYQSQIVNGQVEVDISRKTF